MCKIILWANKLNSKQRKYWRKKREKRNGQAIDATCDKYEGNKSETCINVRNE